MKKYYIDAVMSYCYPYETTKTTKEYGVLSEYIGNMYSRRAMDKIICEMIMKHPYVDNSMSLKIRVMWRENNVSGYYHVFDFENEHYKKQSKGSLEIKYEY